MYDIKVLVTRESGMEYFKGIFKEAEVIPKRLSEPISCDLLIFPGGGDVHPGKYGQRPEGFTYPDEKADATDFSAYNLYRRGIIKAKKVLGICRGLQVLNVSLGGDLIQDLATNGKEHKSIHEVRWMYEITGPMNELEYVNSYHHQALLYVGDSQPARFLAKEPETGIIEAVLWNEVILGVQFHPEFMGDPYRSMFFDSVVKWVEGARLAGDPVRHKRTVNFKSSPFSTGRIVEEN